MIETQVLILNTYVKEHWARKVIGWETTWELLVPGLYFYAASAQLLKISMDGDFSGREFSKIQ